MIQSSGSPAGSLVGCSTVGSSLESGGSREKEASCFSVLFKTVLDLTSSESRRKAGKTREDPAMESLLADSFTLQFGGGGKLLLVLCMNVSEGAFALCIHPHNSLLRDLKLQTQQNCTTECIKTLRFFLKPNPYN